jgi:agmatine deiminase
MSWSGQHRFRLPADWEPQEAVWFAWPASENLWPGVLPRVRRQLAKLYQLAARYEKVCLLCPAAAQADFLSHLEAVGSASHIELFDYATDDVWCRDFGPIFVFDRETAALTATDWGFNAWGEKFPAYQRDASAPAFIAEQLGVPRITFDFVLEGGAIDSNGAGSLLTTEAVLLHPNRNGRNDKVAMEAYLAQGLGVEQVLWLQEGLVGDDTDGHIDNVARFFREDGLLLACTEDATHPNAAHLEESRLGLEGAVLRDGRLIEKILLPLPDPIFAEGQLLAASYLNYLVLNGAVLVPTYGQAKKDAQAIKVLAGCYPGRKVIGFDARDFLLEGGSLHCLSQHQPR